jgi:hypothetical protein
MLIHRSAAWALVLWVRTVLPYQRSWLVVELVVVFGVCVVMVVFQVLVFVARLGGLVVAD